MSRRYQMDCGGYSCGICYRPIKIGDIYVTDHGKLYHAACAEAALAEVPAAPAVDLASDWWELA
jgi:hypothetical protein